jgi:hypothetical protein
MADPLVVEFVVVAARLSVFAVRKGKIGRSGTEPCVEELSEDI